MKNILCLICCGLGWGHYLSAQSVFMNGLQTPLLIHHASAGSRMDSRLCAAFLVSDQVNTNRTAQYISFDQFAPRQRVGWGVYALRESNQQTLNLMDQERYARLFDSPLLDNTKLGQDQYVVGFALSPKYNMKPIKKLNIVSGTVSASAGIEYAFHSEQQGGFGLETTSEVINSDSIRIVRDSLFFTDSRVNAHRLSLQGGLKLNTKNTFVGYQLTLGLEWINEAYQLYSGSQLFNQSSVASQPLTDRLIRLKHHFSVAHVFFNEPRNRWKWNNYLGVQIQHQIPSANPADEFTFVSEAIRYRYSQPMVSALNAVSYLRRNLLMIGAVYHRYLAYQSLGLLTGMNLNKARIVAVYAPFRANHLGRTLELSLNYTFR